MKRAASNLHAARGASRKPNAANAPRGSSRKPSGVEDGASQTPFAEGYAMPAEWEPHAATWLAWPHEASDWPGKFEVIRWVFAEIARVITEGERVRLIVANAAEKKQARAVFKSAGVNLERVDFLSAATDRSWSDGIRVAREL